MRDSIAHPLLPLMLGLVLGPLCSTAYTSDPPALLPALEQDSGPSSSPEFQQKLKKLKAEGDALEAELQTLPKKGSLFVPLIDPEEMRIQARLKAELLRLQQDRKVRTTIQSPSTDTAPKKDWTGNEKPDHLHSPLETKDPPPNPLDQSKHILDPLHLGHALFQVGDYKEALSSFRMVDLTGKKAEERAPIQYLMACCLEHLGQSDEALSLFREAGNSRGDPGVAGYAQWQVDMLRWQRDTLQKLQDIRKRRAALEKLP